MADEIAERKLLGRFNAWALCCFALLAGCSSFHDVVYPTGVTNLFEVRPGLWRSGQTPPTREAWNDLAQRIAPDDRPVTVIKLNDAVEGNDGLAEALLGWKVLEFPLPPEDDKPWTVLEMPDPKEVAHIIVAIERELAQGHIVLVHCTHGRDRTGLVVAAERVEVERWTKDMAWKEMLDHGFRWELPGLDLFFATMSAEIARAK